MATFGNQGGTGYVAWRESLISPWIFVKEFQAANVDFFRSVSQKSTHLMCSGKIKINPPWLRFVLCWLDDSRVLQ
jgi:hypothetical protein